MLEIDEARLDELYTKALHIEPDMVLETERLEKLTEGVRLKLRKENQEIRALRKSRRAQLVQAASTIFDWLRDLAESPKGRKILSTIGEVVIFRGHYHNFKPSDEEEHEAWLTYDSKGVLRYLEYWRGVRVGQTKVLDNPEQMVNRLHPNYVLSALDAITTGEVWKEVECAIRWRAETFDIRRQRGWWPPQTSGQDLVSS